VSKIVGVICVVFFLVQCGCMSSRSYMVDRGFDAADIFTATVGVGAGGVARVGPFSTGMFANTDLCGLRSGVFCIISPLGPDSFQVNALGWGFDVHSGYPFHGCVEARSKQIGHNSYGIPIGISPYWKEHKEHSEIKKNFSALTQIEVAGGVLGTLRLGFNPGELLDFVLGWLTIDIYGDDLAVVKKKREEEQAKIREIEQKTREIERFCDIKLGKTVFVLRNNGLVSVDMSINNPDVNYNIDLIQRKKMRIKKNQGVVKNEDEFYADLQMSFHYDPESEKCEVKFDMPKSMLGGIIYTNKSLNMLPEDGYKKEPVSISLMIGSEKQFFLYVRSREPSVYFRVELTVKLSQKWKYEQVEKDSIDFLLEQEGLKARKSIRDGAKEFRLDYKAFANPYGGRNLEPIWNLPDRVSKKLEKDAREALANGRLAEKPDLIKLIEEVTPKQNLTRK